MDNVLFYVLVAVGSVLGGVIGCGITQYLRRSREKELIRYIRIILPNAKIVEAITVATNDKEAIENIERRIRHASRTL